MKTKPLHWIANNKTLAVALLILILLLPPMLLVTYKAVAGVHLFLSQFGEAGREVAEKFRTTVVAINDKIRATPLLLTGFFITVTLLVPMLGLFLFAWRFTDSWKKRVTPSDVSLDFESDGADTETDFSNTAKVLKPDFGP